MGISPEHYLQKGITFQRIDRTLADTYVAVLITCVFRNKLHEFTYNARAFVYTKY